MKKLCVMCFVLCVLVGSGCTYAKDRANDFVDCFKGDVGYGFGLDAQVMVTELISGGVGASEIKKIGFKGRYIGTWWDLHMGVPIMPFFSFLIFGPATDFVSIGSGKGGTVNDDKGIPNTEIVSFLFINPAFFTYYDPPIINTPLINKFDIEVGGTTVVVGARVGFSPGQFLDFIIGWTGIDIGKDDTKPDAER